MGWTLGLVAMAWLAAAGAARGAGDRTTSPTQVLQRADSRLGSQDVTFDQGVQVVRGADKTLAPFFYVAGGDPETERLPLRETSAQVEIAGSIARVQVRQVFQNGGAKPIEAVYVFPASTRAAVHAMRMKIGGRVVEAKIEKRAEARRQYQQARQEGRRASLLEQERPNVFTMSVANVMPGDRIEVALEYSELLVPEDSVYEFVYPTVVGPRYGGGADPAKDRWIANPTLHQGEKEPYGFDVRVHLESAIGIKDVSSPSHPVDVTWGGTGRADVRLRGPGGGNKDFVLRYRLAGDQIDAGVLLWRGEKESFFLVQMEPPARPAAAQIPPREYVFLLDVSGSMFGFPLDTAKVLVKTLLSRLRPTDHFDIAMFSGGSYVLSPDGSIPATPENVRRASEVIDQQRGGGGTELMGGLRTAYGIPRRDRKVSRTVVVVTDGFVGVEAQAFKFIRENLSQCNLFAFGIGSSVNRGLIEGMARAGQGEPFVVLGPEKARQEAERFAAYIERPVLTQISVRFPGFDAYEVAPMVLPDLLASRPLVLFGKYRGAPAGAIEISGMTGGGRFTRTLDVAAAAPRQENGALQSLWARRWVELLEDEHHLGPAPEIEEAITDLGLAYHLLTPFTSFVAVDSEVVNRSGGSQTVTQPLPMPEGVSDSAVGGLEAEALPASSSGTGMGMMRKESLAVDRTSPAPMAPQPVRADRAAHKPAAPKVTEETKKDLTVVGHWAVSRPTASGLDEVAPLLEAIAVRLREGGESGATIGTAVEVRLGVDRTGKVLKVEVLGKPSAVLRRWLEATLGQVASATRATAGRMGSLVVTLRWTAGG
jgi:Ca-activated chloride channel family protein